MDNENFEAKKQIIKSWSDNNRNELLSYLKSTYTSDNLIHFDIEYKTTWAWQWGRPFASLRIFTTPNGTCVIENNESHDSPISVKNLIDSLESDYAKEHSKVFVVNNQELRKDLQDMFAKEHKMVNKIKDGVFNPKSAYEKADFMPFSFISNDVSLPGMLDGSTQEFKFSTYTVEGHGLGNIITSYSPRMAATLMLLKNENNLDYYKHRFLSDRVRVSEYYYDIVKLFQKYTIPEVDLLDFFNSWEDKSLHPDIVDIKGYKNAPIGAKMEDFVNIDIIEKYGKDAFNYRRS